MYARDFRKRAWQSLRGNWSIGILASLIYIGVGVVVANVPFGALVIAGPLSVGYVSVFLALARRENASLGRMLEVANDFLGTFLAGLLVSLFTFLWTLLFIIPGIIKSYSYSMTYYILRDNPGMPASEAIRCSKEMMDGHKWELFCLHFSFIGWNLLSILTCGILSIFVSPYQVQADAEFYRYLNAEPDYYEQNPYTQNQYDSQM